MISLQTLLSPSERTEFEALVKHAGSEGAQAVRWHSASSGVLVIGLVAGGQLLTWFASPANNEVEAMAVEATILAGLKLAAAGLCDTTQQLAAQAIQRAKAIH